MNKVLIIDDSALYRRVLREILSHDGFAVETARDGREALAKLEIFGPDVVTLDVLMPGMSGLECLGHILRRRPCPVIMVSALTAEGAKETLAALEQGAVDFVTKPDGVVTLAVEDFAPVLLEKVRAARSARVGRASRLGERARPTPPRTQNPAQAALPSPTSKTAATDLSPEGEPQGLVLVGASTGGPVALEVLLSAIPRDFPWPVLVAQHMPPRFTASLAARLDGLCPLNVREVTAPTPLEPGVIYIAAGGGDMVVSRREAGLTVLPAPADAQYRWHPSVDRLVASAMAQVTPGRLIGILMTGMGDDGAKTMTALRRAGGATIAEAQATAVVWGMPRSLIKAGGADVVTPLHTIADHLKAMVPR